MRQETSPPHSILWSLALRLEDKQDLRKRIYAGKSWQEKSLIEMGLETQPMDRGTLNKTLSRDACSRNSESSASQNTEPSVPQAAAFTVNREGSHVAVSTARPGVQRSRVRCLAGGQGDLFLASEP